MSRKGKSSDSSSKSPSRKIGKSKYPVAIERRLATEPLEPGQKQPIQKREPAKPTDVLLLSPYDRLQAIVRHPEYIRQWRKYKETDSLRQRIPIPSDIDDLVKASNVATETYKKFGIPEIVCPNYIKALTSEEVAAKARTYWDPLPVRFLKASEIVYALATRFSQRGVFISYEKLHQVDLLREGRYLMLEADLFQSKETLVKQFKNYLSLKGKANQRKREPTVDPWKVYDMHKGGKNFLQITRKLFGVKGHPAYDPETDALYKQVKKAYQKARQVIETVCPA